MLRTNIKVFLLTLFLLVLTINYFVVCLNFLMYKTYPLRKAKLTNQRDISYLQ